jgi:hypothetical protein
MICKMFQNAAITLECSEKEIFEQGAYLKENETPATGCVL